MKNTLIPLAFSLSLSLPVFSQAADSAPAATLPEFVKTNRFDGVIKAKFETSAETGVMRFNVRNSRVGARGDLNPYISYRVQVELSNEGAFAPLDLFGTIKPFQNFSVLVGQQNIPFDNSYIITPAEMMFANRAFAGKFFTPGSRDIGAVAQYRFNIGGFPMEGQAGVFNGGRINEPRWTDNPSYALRLIAGRMNGFRATAKIYKYNNEQRESNFALTQRTDLFFWGADVHYDNSRFCVQAEVTQRRANDTGLDLFGTYVQGSYTIDLPNSNMFSNWAPAARWDAMGYDGFDVHRITAGINFRLSNIPNSVLRMDYEHYFAKNASDFPDFASRDLHVAHNKVTVELVVRF